MSNKSVRWAFNISKWNPTVSEIRLASSCIQNDQKDRLNKFVFKKDLKYSLIGDLMLRKYVAEASNQSYNTIKFVRDKKGKPLLENNVANLCFNVSHHGNYTVCAGESSEHLLLGVDVMKFEYSGGKSLGEYFRIMNRQFSAEEWVNIRCAGGEREQIMMFCRHWALKESYVKAIGVGITVNLQEISFRVNTKYLLENQVVNNTELYVKGEKMNWNFQETLLDENHCVSVASNKPEHFVDGGTFKFITFEELVKNCVPLGDVDEAFCEGYFKKLDK